MARPPAVEESLGTGKAPVDLPSYAGGQVASGLAQLPWRRIVAEAAGMWLVTRIAFGLVTYIVVNFYTTGFEPIKMGLAGPFPPDLLLRSWQRWDSNWYLNISANA